MKISKTAVGVILIGGAGLAAAGWQEMRKTDREIALRAETTRELNAEIMKLQNKEFENRMEDIRLMR